MKDGSCRQGHLGHQSLSCFLSVGRDPARAHEELEDDLAVVLVEADWVERLGRLPLLLLQVVGQQARLVAHVVRRRQLQVHAQLLLVERQQLVPRETGDGQELGKDDAGGFISKVLENVATSSYLLPLHVVRFKIPISVYPPGRKYPVVIYLLTMNSFGFQ